MQNENGFSNIRTQVTGAMMPSPTTTVDQDCVVTRPMVFIPIELGGWDDTTEVDFWEHTPATLVEQKDFNIEGRDAIVAFCERVAVLTRGGHHPKAAIAMAVRG